MSKETKIKDGCKIKLNKQKCNKGEIRIKISMKRKIVGLGVLCLNDF
ncbi:MAG: hypothetical protein Q8847_02675 [Sweet potato little leaf phytoplasma]|nr:hypothetical protein [Sweet potato little leaf phytoplasma]